MTPSKKVGCAGSIFSGRLSCYFGNIAGDISCIIRKNARLQGRDGAFFLALMEATGICRQIRQKKGFMVELSCLCNTRATEATFFSISPGSCVQRHESAEKPVVGACLYREEENTSPKKG